MIRSYNSQINLQSNSKNDLIDQSNVNFNKPWYSSMSIVSKFMLVTALCFGALMVVTMVEDKGKHVKMVNDYKVGFNDEDIRKILFLSFDSNKIASTLRMVTQEPHQAGTEENRRVGQKLAELWKQNGLEKVKLLEYDVLLSYPNWTNPNKVSLLSDDGKLLFQTTGLSPDLSPTKENDFNSNTVDSYRAAIQWLAYSANGSVESEPVYCHYGQPKDFERLEREFGIKNLNGKIAIIRYGLDYRGDKVKHAAERGAGAVIIFSDPAEVAGGGGSDKAFPHSTWLPSHGVQRGSIMAMKGDPLTPLLPARRDFPKGRTIQQAKKEHYLPSIPVLPLGYADVVQILERMGGPEVPLEWRGALNITYHIGPGFKKERRNDKTASKLRVDVHSTLEIKKIQNVIGIIRGSEEPDSWVMLGNHYDAWVYGALDPNSGTAILAEVGRAFASAVKQGWRPKRTIVFCNWDGEEHGLIGSTEFVQEFAQVLQDRAIIYLNVDTVASNQSLVVNTIPSLFSAVTAAAKQVPNPVASERAKGRHTIYDTWHFYYPQKINSTWLSQDVPDMKLPGGGTDHMSFLNFLGIPVVDFTYRNASWGSYPLYHSRYEVPFVNEHLFDHDNLSVHKAIGQYWTELARSFSDSSILPINASCFALTLANDYLPQIVKSLDNLHLKWKKEMEPAIKQMRNLWKQTWLFVGQTQKFEKDLYSEIELNSNWANLRLRKIDQCFINPSMGLAAKEKEKRHVLFSLSDADTYSASVMSSINTKMLEFENAPTDKKRFELGHELAVELAVVQYSVLCATNILKSFF